MIDRTRASRRLGIVGAAAVVGLVPMSVIGASSAFAVSAGSASLALSTTAAGVSSSATNVFTTNSNLAAGQTITISSLDTTGTPEVLPAAAANYTISYAPVAGGAAVPVTVTSVTLNPGPTPPAGTVATILVGTGIPTGEKVTVTITNVTNATTGSQVYFSDTEASDSSAAVNTNTIAIGNTVTTPGVVTQVNPTAFDDAGGTPFTVFGSNFASSSATTPVICFVESGVTVPAATVADPCVAAKDSSGNIGVAQATVPAADVSPSEIQGTSPVLTAGKTYNVVEYNFNDSAGTKTYTAASATSSVTLAGVGPALNFVPESGVRIVDSRGGLNLPTGALSTSTPTQIPLADFTDSLTLPTNLPAAGYTALSLNVTAVAPSGPGNLQVFADSAADPKGVCGTVPKIATVNFQPGVDTSNGAIVPVPGGSTTLCVVDNGASVNAVMDLTGYATSNYTSVNTRVLDTRAASQVGSLLGPLSGGTVYRFSTESTLGAAADGDTIAINVADVAPSAVGNLRIFPEPATGAPAPSGVPNAAVDTYIPGVDGSSLLITTIPSGVSNHGEFDLYSAGPGTVNAVVDVVGIFNNSGLAGGSSVQATAAPFRVYDSRPGGIASGATATVTASPSGSGSNFVPGGALGVIGNLADINPTGVGNLRTFPAGGVLPGTASINNYPNQTRSNTAVVALNPSNGGMSIESSGASTNATFDATGYIAS